MEFLRNVSALTSLISVLILIYSFIMVCRLIALTPGIIVPIRLDNPNIPFWKFPIAVMLDIIIVTYDILRIATYGPAFWAMILFGADCYITFLGMKYGASLLGVTVGGGIAGIIGIIASIVLKNIGKVISVPNAKVLGAAKWVTK